MYQRYIYRYGTPWYNDRSKRGLVSQTPILVIDKEDYTSWVEYSETVTVAVPVEISPNSTRFEEHYEYHEKYYEREYVEYETHKQITKGPRLGCLKYRSLEMLQLEFAALYDIWTWEDDSDQLKDRINFIEKLIIKKREEEADQQRYAMFQKICFNLS